MCRKALFEKNFLAYASSISMQIKASYFLHIFNVYSHTKLNTPVLVLSLQLSNFGLNHVTENFSVTIDCLRFLLRRFPLYTYSMVSLHTILHQTRWGLIIKNVTIFEVCRRKRDGGKSQ